MWSRFCLAACFMALVAVEPQNAFASALTHWWKADGDVVDSITGQSGTLIGSTTFAPGLFGQEAFSFDGVNSHIDLGSGNFIGSGNAPCTISMWIDPAGTPDDFYYLLAGFTQDTQLIFPICKNYCVSGEYIGIYFRGHIQWWVPLNLDALVGNWNLVTAEYNGGDKDSASSFSYYLNGTLLTGAPVNVGEVGYWANDNRLGFDHANIADYAGLMEDVRIYNGVLSPAEVQALASVPEPTTLLLLTLGGLALRRRK